MAPKEVTCSAERKMVLAFPQSSMGMDTKEWGTYVLLFSWQFYPCQKCFKGRLPVALGGSIEALICNFFLSFFNIKTPSLLTLTMDGKKEKKGRKREKGRKRPQREGEKAEKKEGNSCKENIITMLFFMTRTSRKYFGIK